MVGGDPVQLLTIHLGAVIIHVFYGNQFTSIYDGHDWH